MGLSKLWKNPITKGILGATMPTFATAILGPMGPLAAGFISKQLGIEIPPEPDKAEEAIAKAAAQNPDILLKLKESDAALQAHFDDNGIKLAEINQRDRDSARNREIELAKTGQRDWTPAILAYSVVAGVFIIAFTLLYAAIRGIEIPMGINTTLSMVLGVLIAKFGSVYDYFFGSSSGSSRKTDILAEKA